LAQKGSPRPDDAQRDFLQRFLHDLATPLSAVSLHLEGVDRRIKRGADPSEPLAIARAELSRAFELFEHGRECLLAPAGPAETFAFDDFVASTLEQNASSVAIEGTTGALVTGDRQALSQALLALVGNALEAAADGRIWVRRERVDGWLRAQVENPGSLPAGDPEVLFSPRTSRDGRHWGMGLPRARLQAAAAGGMVRLEQREDRITAILELPETKP
jgi:signal transduction histidine kinase